LNKSWVSRHVMPVRGHFAALEGNGNENQQPYLSML
jgi:hypothetical protein